MAREIAGRKEIVKTNSVHKEKSLLLPAFRLQGSLWGWCTSLCFCIYILLYSFDKVFFFFKSRAYTLSGLTCVNLTPALNRAHTLLLLSCAGQVYSGVFFILNRVTLRHIPLPILRTVMPPLH